MHAVSLNWLDLIVIGAYFLVILVIGLRLRRGTNTSAEFFYAGQSLPASHSWQPTAVRWK